MCTPSSVSHDFRFSGFQFPTHAENLILHQGDQPSTFCSVGVAPPFLLASLSSTMRSKNYYRARCSRLAVSQDSRFSGFQVFRFSGFQSLSDSLARRVNLHYSHGIFPFASVANSLTILQIQFGPGSEFGFDFSLGFFGL